MHLNRSIKIIQRCATPHLRNVSNTGSSKTKPQPSNTEKDALPFAIAGISTGIAFLNCGTAKDSMSSQHRHMSSEDIMIIFLRPD